MTRTVFLAIALAAAAAAGCQNRTFLNVGKVGGDPEYGLLLKSIDQYARKHGLSRDQAIRQLREEADRNAREGRNACCPSHGGAVPASYEAADPPPSG